MIYVSCSRCQMKSLSVKEADQVREKWGIFERSMRTTFNEMIRSAIADPEKNRDAAE